MAKDSYITKLLTLLVSRAENKTIRIPAAELMAQDVGKGITVYWDDQSKELVLSYLPKGATAYIISENQTWLANQIPQSPSNQPELPKSQDELIAKAWTESAATPSNQELAQRRSKVVHVEDQDIVLAEAELRKREIMKSIENFQSPEPAVTTRSKIPTTFYKQ